MQNVNTATRDRILAMYPIRVQLEIDGQVFPGEILHISHGAAISSGDYPIGRGCSATATVTVDAVNGTVLDKRARVRWQVTDADWYPLISGTITEAKTEGGSTKLTIADAMETIGGRPYDIQNGMLMDCGAEVIAADIAAQLGTLAVTEDFAGPVIPGGAANLMGSTLAEAAGQLAALLGGCAVIDRAGKLALRRAKAADINLEAYGSTDRVQPEQQGPMGLVMVRSDTMEVETPEGGTQNIAQESRFVAGPGPERIEIANNLATQALADGAWARIQDVKYHSGEAEFAAGLLMEPGDIFPAVVSGGEMETLATEVWLEIDGGCRTRVRSSAPMSGARGSIQRRVQQIQDRIYTLEHTAAGLIAEAKNLQGELTRIEQTAEQIALEAVNKTMSTFLRVTPEGVEIGRNDSPYSLMLDDTGVAARLGEQSLAIFGQSGLEAPIATLGMLAFETDTYIAAGVKTTNYMTIMADREALSIY